MHRKGEMGNPWGKDNLTDYAESIPLVFILLEASVDKCLQSEMV